jgi:hypothetical protein
MLLLEPPRTPGRFDERVFGDTILLTNHYYNRQGFMIRGVHRLVQCGAESEQIPVIVIEAMWFKKPIVADEDGIRPGKEEATEQRKGGRRRSGKCSR